MQLDVKPLVKITGTKAIEITKRVELSQEALAFLLPTLSPQGYLSLLVQAGLVGDGIRFLAFALPGREAVWWACVVAHTMLTEQSDLVKTCLKQSAEWVYEPTEERRRVCYTSAEQCQFEGAAAYVALAAFWSGGNLAPDGFPEIDGNPQLCPIGVGASVLLSVTANEPLKLNNRFEKVIARGVEIARGGNGWMKNDQPLVIS